MIFDLDGHRFKVSFGHELFKPPIEIPANAQEFSPYKTNIVRAKSTCFIAELFAKGEPPKLLAKGVTYCSVTENFNKATGREWAFWRALKAVSPHPNKFWEMTIKTYAHSGAHRPPKEIQKLAQAEPGQKAA